MSRIVLFVIIGMFSTMLGAVEFKPYPSAKITKEQWLSYYQDVSTKHKSSVKIVKEQYLEIYSDEENTIMIAFTQKGHPAHPAWVSRMPVEKDGVVNIRTIGYFAGDEPPFAMLYKQYLESNEKVKEHINQ